MKVERQNKILNLVSENQIETQEDLLTYLRAAGYAATQATVSRDIRELKLSKMLTPDGNYRYVVPKNDSDAAGAMSFNAALAESIRSVRRANNILVIKTYPGLAQAVAYGIDQIESDEILGCVAGDDTIMVVMNDESSADKLRAKMLEMKEAAGKK